MNELLLEKRILELESELVKKRMAFVEINYITKNSLFLGMKRIGQIAKQALTPLEEKELNKHTREQTK